MERKGPINYFLDSPPPTPPFGLLFPTHLPQHRAVSSWELAAGLGFCKWPHLVLNFCFPSAFGKHCCIFNKSIYLWYNWWAFHFFFQCYTEIVLYWGTRKPGFLPIRSHWFLLPFIKKKELCNLLSPSSPLRQHKPFPVAPFSGLQNIFLSLFSPLFLVFAVESKIFVGHGTLSCSLLEDALYRGLA